MSHKKLPLGRKSKLLSVYRVGLAICIEMVKPVWQCCHSACLGGLPSPALCPLWHCCGHFTMLFHFRIIPNFSTWPQQPGGSAPWVRGTNWHSLSLSLYLSLSLSLSLSVSLSLSLSLSLPPLVQSPADCTRESL